MLRGQEQPSQAAAGGEVNDSLFSLPPPPDQETAHQYGQHQGNHACCHVCHPVPANVLQTRKTPGALGTVGSCGSLADHTWRSNSGRQSVLRTTGELVARLMWPGSSLFPASAGAWGHAPTLWDRLFLQPKLGGPEAEHGGSAAAGPVAPLRATERNRPCGGDCHPQPSLPTGQRPQPQGTESGLLKTLAPCPPLLPLPQRGHCLRPLPGLGTRLPRRDPSKTAQYLSPLGRIHAHRRGSLLGALAALPRSRDDR